MTRDTLIKNALQSHEKHFDQKVEVTSVAPARVNLIGEHTDYNEGFVLPAAIDFYTCVSGKKANGPNVNVVALDYDDDNDQFSIGDNMISPSPDLWKNFVRGAFYILKDEGYDVSGCNLTISGNIPKGAGLSSSASLEVALLSTLNELFSLNLSKLKIALIGQRIENDFVGLSCGIMDQLSVACGEKDKALLMDCRDYSINTVNIPKPLSLLIINSNVKRELADSEYNTRRKACEQANELLGLSSLRELDEFAKVKDKLPEIVARRVRHVVSENERVLNMTDALKNENIAQISDLMKESHASMRDDYEITVPAIDILVKTVEEQIGSSGGVRMTGGGFGGCVIALVPRELVPTIKKSVIEIYEKKTGLEASFYLCNAADGVYTLT